MCKYAVAQDLKLWYTKPAIKWTEACRLAMEELVPWFLVALNRTGYNSMKKHCGQVNREIITEGAYKYLDSIRQLLFAGKQKEAEALAEKEFMGTKSNEGKKEAWLKICFAKQQSCCRKF